MTYVDEHMGPSAQWILRRTTMIRCSTGMFPRGDSFNNVPGGLKILKLVGA